MAYTFDGSTKRITLSAGTVTLDLVDMHARWKDWMLAGNASCLPAFKAVGGDIPAIPLYLFIMNGWRVVPQSADHTLTVINGVFEVEGGGDPFVDPAGSFKIRINREAPGIAIGYSTTGVPAPSAAEVAVAVVAALNATAIPVDAKKINGVQIAGDGTIGDKFRSHLVG